MQKSKIQKEKKRYACCALQHIEKQQGKKMPNMYQRLLSQKPNNRCQEEKKVGVSPPRSQSRHELNKRDPKRAMGVQIHLIFNTKCPTRQSRMLC
jgi:hypothetical protein